MRLRHIEIFHAVYTSGSITGAAKLLNVSQPSVSKVLAHAELQLGFHLFERVKGRLIPTSEAVLLFDEVDRIYQQIGTIRDVAANIRNNETGRIALALTPALGFEVIPSIVAEFRKQYPKVGFQLTTLHNDRVSKHLTRHKSELAVMFAPEKHSGFSEVEFGEGRMVVAYPKALLPDCPKVIALEDVVKYPLINIWDSGPLADLVWEAMNAKNLRSDNAIQVQTYFIAVNLVRHGTGVCIVDEFTAAGQLSDQIAVAELAEPIKFPIKGLYLENKPISHATQELITCIQNHMK